MEKALQNSKITKKYHLSLKTFFKDEFKYSDDSYLIPFSHIQYTKRQIFDYIRSSCGNDDICSKLQMCYGHQFLQFIELIYQFNYYSITKEKIYFEYFLFNNFKYDSQMTLIPSKIKSWHTIPVQKHLLHDLTYSQRLTFLK